MAKKKTKRVDATRALNSMAGMPRSQRKTSGKSANTPLNSISDVPDLPEEPTTAEGGVVVFGHEERHASICQELQSLQRERQGAIKQMVMQTNGLTMMVATAGGYFSGLEKDERKAAYKRAEKLIGEIVANKVPADQQQLAGRMNLLVESTAEQTKKIKKYIAGLDKMMVHFAEQLPVAQWAAGVRGFGLLRLAVVIGETGDLSNYSGPCKVWKRLGLAPFKGKAMSTHRKEGGLSAAEWSACGYSPRRRSVMFVIGDLLMKGNYEKTSGSDVDVPHELDSAIAVDLTEVETAEEDGDAVLEFDLASVSSSVAKSPGPYRQCYDKHRAIKQAAGWVKLRVHRHAMLMATKALILDLWKQWNPTLVKTREEEPVT